MTTRLTPAGINNKAQAQADELPWIQTNYILAYVPGLKFNDPIPDDFDITESQIVRELPISKAAYVDDGTVVYSLLLGAEEGNYKFNVEALRDSSGDITAISWVPLVEKRKTENGLTGNVLGRNFVHHYTAAKTLTGINIPVEAWQFDFTSNFRREVKELDKRVDQEIKQFESDHSQAWNAFKEKYQALLDDKAAKNHEHDYLPVKSNGGLTKKLLLNAHSIAFRFVSDENIDHIWYSGDSKPSDNKKTSYGGIYHFCSDVKERSKGNAALQAGAYFDDSGQVYSPGNPQPIKTLAEMFQTASRQELNNIYNRLLGIDDDDPTGSRRVPLFYGSQRVDDNSSISIILSEHTGRFKAFDFEGRIGSHTLGLRSFSISLNEIKNGFDVFLPLKLYNIEANLVLTIKALDNVLLIKNHRESNNTAGKDFVFHSIKGVR